MINYLIFDMDGTLIDSSAIISNSINYVRSKLGLPPMDKKVILEAVNDTSIHRPKFFYGVEEYEPKHVEWFREYYANNHHKETVLYTGVKELLEEIKPYFRLFLATNAYRVSAELILKNLGIYEYFEIIVCGDEVPHPKPAPDMIFKIIDYFGCKKDEILLIGDGKTDEEAACAAGIGFLKVNWGWSEYEDAIKSVEELKEILLSLKA
ncbi:phosphoglycolate phosphatase [Nitratiruptor sp. YY08-26]|uniref:HAD family hydrolase n=1 Tax=unclassified Nitratiruptor TaxID=2624044 RepID=UPI001914FE33|nr:MULTISPECIES: HAD family hydrolase [unclassified Nitratiruptor]BCD63149.1 phosphoglycolate phosphatase [Nitratiruptor sp. YY08-13]BCD67084.1 phosphoglycolate phosphatase [Nitratiruptor sp. YY08-26]